MHGTERLGLTLAACFAAGTAFGGPGERLGAAAPSSVATRSVVARALTDRLTVDGYLGYLTGESRELVYDSGRKVSQLNWEIDGAAVVGTRFDYAVTGWLALEAGGWASLASDSQMTDYDWLWPDTGHDGWTDRSVHPNTSLERAFEIDLAAKARLAQWQGIWLQGLVGYQVRNFKWRASNGHYTYSQFEFRDTEGSFNGPMVDYQQWWRTPYVGLAAGYAMPRLRLTGRVIASPFARIADQDVHIENAQQFTGDFGETNMAAVTIRAEHDLTENLMLTGEANYQRFWEARGDMTVRYLDFDGWTSELSDAAGASNQALLLSLGLAYRF